MYNPKKYREKIKEKSTKTRLWRNVLCAFMVGGFICFLSFYMKVFYMQFVEEKDAYLLVTVTLIFIGALLSCVGLYDRIAHMAGAGTLVPVTGFANSIASVALDSRSEGYVLGVGSKIFTVAGPVILYSTVFGIVYGIIYYCISFFL